MQLVLCWPLFVLREEAVNKPLRMCKHPGCQRLTSTGYCPEHKPRHERKASASWHSWYTNPHYGWAKRRDNQLAAEPFCRECAKHGLRVKATEADHIEPHRGDLQKFLHGELQSLCHTCHSRKTVQENADVFTAKGGKNR